ncbi:MAG: Hsp20/alpha crystallin family protein [Candidatus Binatus sp.]|uniref:Hsp20/alpha crystallin family protein n=1 Tax=Candidatus Binatus sp. TaxID=2811406 RepID=UPI002717D722|nr:Hsp20/alpha crystallin family protein [Candidatus Binatus sp.]MDO8432136.1 Hsp20/alpha crystallin family protein [Candidatus Binatus sp.]
MALPEKWNPSRELERLRHEFDDLLERLGFEHGGLFKDWQTTALRPAIESFVDGDKYTVRVELPGIAPKDVDIKVVSGVLTVKGSREEKHETKKRDFLRREFRYGSFERAITLPEGMKAEDLKATFHDGVLELVATMPKEALPKEVKVQIQIGEAKKPDNDQKAP